MTPKHMAEPDASGRFGEFGGRYIPESLMPACLALEEQFRATGVVLTDKLPAGASVDAARVTASSGKVSVDSGTVTTLGEHALPQDSLLARPSTLPKRDKIVRLLHEHPAIAVIPNHVVRTTHFFLE